MLKLRQLWRRSSRSVGDKAPSPPPAGNPHHGDGDEHGNSSNHTDSTAIYSVTNNKVDFSIETSITCKLCLTEVTETYTLVDCGCTYCQKCCEQYLKVMILEGNIPNITCPDAACKTAGRFKSAEIEKLVDRKLFERYSRLKFEREVELDPLRTFCPEVGCDTICHVCYHSSVINCKDGRRSRKTKTKVITKPGPITCPTCSLTFCSMCKAKWHGGQQSCDDVMRNGRKEDEGIPFSAVEEAQIKRCPVCHVPIERNDGCAQMMCKRCKHVFCWYCLTSLDDDFLLRHYDKGPCKNKLGHSRASVIWHRAQVVGIFAGFGILLLVASPFLLLAAPCILCCKCKVCKCCDDDDSLGTADGMSSSS